jgi:hypothetical protein
MTNDWTPDRGGGLVRRLGAGRSIQVGPDSLDFSGPSTPRRYRWSVYESDGARSVEGQGLWPTAGQACADAERVLSGMGIIPFPPRSVCPHCGQQMPNP